MLRNKLISTSIVILAIFAFAIVFAGDDDDDDDAMSPPVRFTLLFNDEVVRDNETGLEWQRIPNNTPTSSLANINLCLGINTGNRQGWRPPFIYELASIFDPNAIPDIKLVEEFPFNETDIDDFYGYTGINPFDPSEVYCVDTSDGLVKDANGCPPSVVGNILMWCVRAFNSGN